MNGYQIRRIGIVGAGLMGRRIAQEFALSGYPVHLHDLNEEQLQEACRSFETAQDMARARGQANGTEAGKALTAIHCSTDLEEVATQADIVIEAVVEDLEVKQKVFADLDRWCPAETILASNTSTLLPTWLASATSRPDKVLVTHYFNPPHLLPLVEIVRGQETSDETVSTVFALLLRLGKKPAIVQREVPGFIGNRLQAALLREAISIVEQGIATPQDVDTVIKNGFGRRLAVAGVFEVFELAGWDLVQAVARNLLPEIESSKEVPLLLNEKVQRGELGIKTGQGFYSWTPEAAEELTQRISRALVEMSKWS